MTNKIRNTTTDIKNLGKIDLIGALAASQPSSIYASERAGQQELIQSSVLPVEMSIECRRVLEAHGVRFGDGVEGDPLFVHATLPAGWTKRGTDHNMHSVLLDEQGRVRAGIFYKAAFYDRRASMHAVCRFKIEQYDECDQSGQPAEKGTHYLTTVKDADVICHVVGWRLRGPDGRDQMDALQEQAEKWLDDHRPQWRDAAAYWTTA